MSCDPLGLCVHTTCVHKSLKVRAKSMYAFMYSNINTPTCIRYKKKKKHRMF